MSLPLSTIETAGFLSPNGNTDWLEVIITIDPVSHEALSAFLFDLGTEGIVHGHVQDPSLKAYFPFPADWEGIQDRIEAFLGRFERIFPEVRTHHLSLNVMENRDWNRHWRQFFRPDQITPRLMLVPAWEEIPSHQGDHVIRMDPGPAFGTGQHPTTRMCLKAMEEVLPPSPWALLDVGTGSGILAIYGARLGASRILALDTDSEALRWAARNIALNHLTPIVILSSIPLHEVRESFSMIVANLTLRTILDLFPHMVRLLKPRGWLTLSGILREQGEEVEGLLAGGPFDEIHLFYDQEWACATARLGDCLSRP